MRFILALLAVISAIIGWAAILWGPAYIAQTTETPEWWLLYGPTILVLLGWR